VLIGGDSKLKNNIGVVLILLGMILGLTACNSNISTTNLTSIKIDNMQVGEYISDVDLEKYTTSDRFTDKENTYNFEEIKIETDESGIITQIHANNVDTELLINDVEGFKDIEDITTVLDENYKSSWYDREQGLKENKYMDLENKIEASFIYDNTGKNLVWTILSKIN
jgi:hypothetical protein